MQYMYIYMACLLPTRATRDSKHTTWRTLLNDPTALFARWRRRIQVSGGYGVPQIVVKAENQRGFLLVMRVPDRIASDLPRNLQAAFQADLLRQMPGLVVAEASQNANMRAARDPVMAYVRANAGLFYD